VQGVAGFAGEVVTFAGRLLTVSRKRAAEIVTQLGGIAEPDLSVRTTLLVIGADSAAATTGTPTETDAKIRRAAERVHEPDAPRLLIVDEDAFCMRAGLITPAILRGQYYACGAIRSMYTAIRDEHLRYLEKWGVLRSVVRTPGETWFAFSDLAVIKQANDELARGAGVKGLLRTLAAEREGQLALDFHARGDGSPRIVHLAPRPERASAASKVGREPENTADLDAAEELFVQASRLDTDDATGRPAAMTAYRRALLLAPQLVPAMVNLGNMHYAEDQFAEAQALYVQAALTDPECFEAHFNLGNLLHDLGRFREAESAYREALRIDPQFADAHFYLAVTLEKQNRSPEARPYWKRYQDLAPQGEWAELAKEFTE
jgi:predicted TPR repeat methyltransferase